MKAEATEQTILIGSAGLHIGDEGPLMRAQQRSFKHVFTRATRFKSLLLGGDTDLFIESMFLGGAEQLFVGGVWGSMLPFEAGARVLAIPTRSAFAHGTELIVRVRAPVTCDPCRFAIGARIVVIDTD